MKFSFDSASKTAEIIGAIVSEYNAAITSINDKEFVCTYVKWRVDGQVIG